MEDSRETFQEAPEAGLQQLRPGAPKKALSCCGMEEMTDPEILGLFGVSTGVG